MLIKITESLVDCNLEFEEVYDKRLESNYQSNKWVNKIDSLINRASSGTTLLGTSGALTSSNTSEISNALTGSSNQQTVWGYPTSTAKSTHTIKKTYYDTTFEDTWVCDTSKLLMSLKPHREFYAVLLKLLGHLNTNFINTNDLDALDSSNNCKVLLEYVKSRNLDFPNIESKDDLKSSGCINVKEAGVYLSLVNPRGHLHSTNPKVASCDLKASIEDCTQSLSIGYLSISALPAYGALYNKMKEYTGFYTSTPKYMIPS